MLTTDSIIQFTNQRELAARRVAATHTRQLILIALTWAKDNATPTPVGHASLVASLSEVNGLEVREIVQAVNLEDFAFERLVESVRQHLSGPAEKTDIAIGAYVWNDVVVRDLLKALRERGVQNRIILGGPQVSNAPACLEHTYPEADVFIRGQAESALTALARTHGRPRIKGVHYAGMVDQCDQAFAAIVQCPSPWLSGRMSISSGAPAHWETQRGCQFQCAFCQHRSAGSSKAVSKRQSERINREINLFCDTLVGRISVLDPVFNYDDSHACEILERFVARGFSGELSLQCRAEMVSERFIDLAAQLNVELEFGIQSIHRAELDAVCRRNNLPKVERIIRELKKRRIKHEVSLIYGLPNQTVDSFRESVRWCLTQGIAVIKAFPLLLLRGTPLAGRKDDWSLAVDDGELPMVVSSSTFDRGDWDEMARIAAALASSEGNHPRTITELQLAESGRPHLLASERSRALGKGGL